MPNATIQLTTFRDSITVDSLQAALQAAKIRAGFVLADNWAAGSDRFSLYSLNLSSATYGQLWSETRIYPSSTVWRIAERLHFNWNAATRTSEAQTDYSPFITTASGDILLTSCNHPECRLVIFQQGSGGGYLGYLRPGPAPLYKWDENRFPYCFIPDNGLSTLYLFKSALNPFNSTSTAKIEARTYLQNPDFQSKKIDVITGVTIGSPGNFGIAGAFSPDIAQAATTGENTGTLLPVGQEQYYLLKGGTSGLCIKCDYPVEV